MADERDGGQRLNVTVRGHATQSIPAGLALRHIEGIGESIMVGAAKDCYGKMFPPVIRQSDNVTIAGKVLSYHVERLGVVATDHSVSVDEKAWRQCATCEDHGTCYRLSTSKLLLEIALTA